MKSEIIIEKIKNVFSEYARDKHYSDVWLSEVDLLGINSNEYILNVKSEHLTDSTEEIEYILRLLDNYAEEELKYIWRVVVHDVEEAIA